MATEAKPEWDNDGGDVFGGEFPGELRPLKLEPGPAPDEIKRITVIARGAERFPSTTSFSRHPNGCVMMHHCSDSVTVMVEFTREEWAEVVAKAAAEGT